ncbi:MAG: polysaccharide biosynthesis/export family protein [Syntrophobacteraceae bacterium]
MKNVAALTTLVVVLVLDFCCTRPGLAQTPTPSVPQTAQAGAPPTALVTPNNLPATPGTAMPAPAAPPAFPAVGLAPFGASLFAGQAGVQRHDAANPDYIIQPGDRVALHVWGAKTADDILTVDTQGNVFVPEVGPLKVAGVRNSQLNQVVRDHVGRVFKDKVEIYTNLVAAQQIGVFVTGYVSRPGHYPGGPGDSFIDYLNKAGGVDPKAGSYRHAKVLRKNKKIASVDLYQFLMEGHLPSLVFQDMDTIVVERKGASAAATGSVKNNALFEFRGPTVLGKNMLDFAGTLPGTSHVWIAGARSGSPFNAYMTMEDFSAITVLDGDSMTFYADARADTIQVRITGAAYEGNSTFAVKRTAKLHDLLRNIPVNRELADFQSLYIKRRGIATKQKKALDESLVQLEKALLTAPAVTEGEASIRVKEAEMIGQFVSRAKLIEPEGRLVVARGGVVADINLEDGDEIVIAQKSDVVIIAGEVLMPQAIVASLGTGVKDYIQASGGFSPRGDKSKVVVIKPNGETVTGANPPVGPGDQVLVLPKVESKIIQIAATITQILYQVAVGAGVALKI